MASNFRLIYTILCGEESDDIKATKFLNEIERENSGITRGDILGYLRAITENARIPINIIVRKYHISLERAEQSYGLSYFLEDVHNSKSPDEFNKVIEFYKENSYKTVNFIAKLWRRPKQQMYMKYFKFAKTELISVAQTCAQVSDAHTLGFIDEVIKLGAEEIFQHKIFHTAAKNNELPIIKWMCKRFAIEATHIKNSGVYWVASDAKSDKVCEWIMKTYSLDLTRRPEKLMSNLFKGMSADDQAEHLRTLLMVRNTIPNEKIREAINMYCAGEKTFYNEVNSAILLKILEVYDFSSKSSEEVTEIVNRICGPDMVTSTLAKLIILNIIPGEKKKLTLDELKEEYPEYVIEEPKKLVEHIFKKFTL